MVKPADKDGGRGVHAFLCSEEEVTHAFREASKISSNIIVEKYFEGNDYRVQVFQGHAYSVNQRVPASVTGDGTSTVRELVDVVNEDPQRGPPGSPWLTWIVLDEEAVKWLERQSLTVDSVPARNQFVRLRGAANIATGGSLEPVLEETHPDNLRLAERAVNLLRLDLAGVDLLIPDIRQSWQDTGAVICEVNAQPQMAPDLPEQVLPKLMKGNGRVPVILVLGEMDRAALSALESAMARHYGQVGCVSPEGVRIGGLSTSVMPGDSFAAAQFLIRDPSVACILLQVRDNAILQQGSPFDRIDHLIVADDLPHSSRAQRLQISDLRLMLTATADHAWILQDTAAPELDSRYSRIRSAEITHIITAAHPRKKTKP